MNEQVINTMFALIRAEVCGAEISEKIKNGLTAEMLPQLYSLSKSHDMAHIIAQALSNLGMLGDDEISAKFQKQQMLAVYRYQRINYELGEICRVLEEAKIPFIPLKGAVIRQYYPEPWMRTSCDIDVLVHEENLDRVTGVLSNQLYYTSDFIGPHDVSMYSPSGVHIEIHYDLIEEEHIGTADLLLKDVWDYSAIAPKFKTMLKMRDDFFYYYHLAHLSKHIRSGGCGIRPFLDLYILNHNMDFNKKSIDEILSKGGLKLLAKAATELSEYWFGDGTIHNANQFLQKYIIQSGTYGNLNNATIVHHVSSNVTKKKFFSRIWKPYNELKYWYPILVEHRWLTPICQIKRWGKILFGGTLTQIFNKKKLYQNTAAEEILDVQQMLRQLGLD